MSEQLKLFQEKAPVTDLLPRAGSPGDAARRMNFTPEQRLDIVVGYRDRRESTVTLADRYGTRPGTILNVLRQESVTIRSPKDRSPRGDTAAGRANRAYANEEEKQIAAEYAAGNSSLVVACKWGCHPCTVREIAKKHGVAIRRGGNCHTYRPPLEVNDAAWDSTLGRRERRAKNAAERRATVGKTSRRYYDIDEALFERPPSHLSSYLAGFIAGDGCVTLDGRTLKIALAVADVGHIEKIRTVICPEVPISFDWHPDPRGVMFQNATVNFCSTRLVKSLRAFGVGPRKTWDLKPWDGPIHLLPSYYLGLIDADGYWSAARQPSGAVIWGLGLVGTFDICEGFSRFVESYSGCYTPPKPHVTIFKTHIRGLEQVREIARILYRNAPMWLDCKKAVADEMMAYRPRIRDWSHMTKEDLLRLFEENDQNWSAVARHLGLLPFYVRVLRRRVGLL